MSEQGSKQLPRGLQNRITGFGFSVMLMIALVGVLMGMVTVRGIWNYQSAMSQTSQVCRLQDELRMISELMQNLVMGEENATECFSAWQDLNEQVKTLSLTESTTVRLLVEDLQAYQRNTDEDFFSLMRQVDKGQPEEAYRQFLVQQDGRQFLCELLITHLTDEMAAGYPAIVRENLTYLFLLSLVLVGLLLLTGLFSYTFARDIYQPVQKLTDQAGQLMDGNYQMEDILVLQQDEIGYLTEVFNAMKNQVRENFQNQEELWRMESLLQDAEFRALQSQVNPHFLFNVLGVALEAALTENADRTMDVIENISYMLHYSLTSVRENAWLADELKMVRSYLFLQRKRFGDRIEFIISVPDEVISLRIPGMTLQPIVENAVMHGVEGMTAGGRIEVIMTVGQKTVEICVRDNGRGMPFEQVEALNQGKSVRETSGSTGLGVANVWSRMGIFYNQSGLLRIKSQEGIGTAVYLTYCIRKEDLDASSLNRG